MKTAREIFANIKNNARKGFAYHVGYTTVRRYNEVCRLIENEWLNAKVDLKLGIIDKAEFDSEMHKIEIMKMSLETAHF